MNIEQLELIATISAIEKVAEMGGFPPEAVFGVYMSGESTTTKLINNLVDEAVKLVTMTEHLARHKGQTLEETLNYYMTAAPDVKTALRQMEADRAAIQN